jgi:energy-coupling factor transporter ATP-binding protein EcfA2
MQDFEYEFGARAKNDSGPEIKPRHLTELDIRQSVVEDILLKILYLCGALSLGEVTERLRLGYEVVDELFCKLRAQTLCQVTGMSGTIPQIALTSQGRVRATELLAQSQYAGAAPVALESYVEMVKRQSVQKVDVHAADVRRAFSHLVIEEEMLDQFGTALNSGSSVFLYGPAGTGKTTVAEVLSRVLAEDEIWIPHAVEVDGQIITLFDPAIHREVAFGSHDDRWARCQRPAVMVGGELTVEMLDMQFNPMSRFYVSPVQMKANNGVFIVDDFGRQRIRPDELLNRWIVPLDRRKDFLTLMGGKKIEIPFEMLVVFASNTDPKDLVDPAFLRRIQTKIKIGAVTDEQFMEIFKRVATEKSVSYDQDVPLDLINFIRGSLNQDLRSCYPRDIINQVCWSARYEGKAAHVDHPALLRAVEAYFPMNS